jgi:hypothetical protein
VNESLVSLETAIEGRDSDEIQIAWDETLDAWADFRGAPEVKEEVDISNLQLAWRNLEFTMEAALGVSPNDEAIAGIRHAWENVELAFDEIAEDTCP